MMKLVIPELRAAAISADSAAQTVDLLQRFAVPDWPVMCVRPIAVTNNLRAHQSLESVHHLNRHWVRCMSSTRVTDPAQTVGAAAGRKPDDERADLPGLRGSLIISFPPARAATPAPRSRHAGCRDPAAADMFDFQARQRGRGAVPSSARPVCGLPGGLDVRDLAHIPGDQPRRRAPKLLRAMILRPVRRHAPGRLDQAAVQPPSGPSNPARRPRRR
jgi:hypothetical protein